MVNSYNTNNIIYRQLRKNGYEEIIVMYNAVWRLEAGRNVERSGLSSSISCRHSISEIKVKFAQMSL